MKEGSSLIRFNPKNGLTITELLIALFIMVLVVSSAISVSIMLTNAWKEGSTQIALQREANIAMEKMVRGVDGQNGIREANSATPPNSSSIRYTSGVDSKERSFYLNSGEIVYDPNTSVSGDEFPIARNVRTLPSGLTFSVSGNVVTIKLGMRSEVMDRQINVDLSTHVKLRN